MRILFMGTPDFAIPSLSKLIENGYKPVAVVTAPDRSKGRGLAVTPAPVKVFAVENDIAVLQPENLKSDEFLSEVSALQIDLACVVAFRILPVSVLEIPRLGSVNLHASLLPRYRGAAPIQRALMAGETETGVTTFLIEKEVDTGKLLYQRSVSIEPEDDAGTLHDKLAQVGADLLLETVRSLQAGTYEPRQQNDSLASPAPKIGPRDLRIDWSKTATEISNQIRALSPYPGAATTLHGVRIKIYSATVIDFDAGTAKPGEVIKVEKDELIIAAREGVLSIIKLQKEGKKRMNTADFLRGFHLEVGDILE